MGEVVRFPSALLSTALAERLLYNFLQQYLSFHPQEDLHQQGHAPCSGVNCLGEGPSTWRGVGQSVGWMDGTPAEVRDEAADKLGI